MRTAVPDGSSTSTATDTDRIVLEIPGDSRLRGVASLVLGGIGSRIELPYEKVDELQLAVLTVLGACDVEAATIEVEIGETGVLVNVGPLPVGTASAPGLRAVLERLVDGVEASTRRTRSERPEWVTLRLARPASE
jgi:hypothetical protein